VVVKDIKNIKTEQVRTFSLESSAIIKMPTVTLLLTLGWFSTASLVVASIMRPPCPADLEERHQNLIHDQEHAVMAGDFWRKSGIDYPSELEEMPCTILGKKPTALSIF
jgi:hypothetical protein